MIFFITGIAGFMPSHLGEELLNRGHCVIGVDNFFCGHRKNLERLFESDNFELYEMDATNQNEIFKLLLTLKSKYRDKWHSSVYINMATTSLLYSLRHPLYVFNSEISLCKAMCAVIKHKIVERGIQFSTSEVYGNCGDYKISNWHNCCPTTTYGTAKLTADNLVANYRNLYGLEISIIRPFNNYGERQDRAIIPVTINRILDGKSPVIHGDGLQKRDFLYVRDTVAVIIDILEKDVRNNQTTHVDWMLASGNAVTVKEVVKSIMHEMSFEGGIKYEKRRVADIDCLTGCCVCDKLVLTSFDMGLKNTINWWKEKRRRENGEQRLSE